MPITRQQFDLGIDADVEALMRQLVAFLEARKDEAFSSSELWEERFGSGGSKPEDRARFSYTLQKLVDHGVVREREVAGVNYYSIGSVRLTEVLKA